MSHQCNPTGPSEDTCDGCGAVLTWYDLHTMTDVTVAFEVCAECDSVEDIAAMFVQLTRHEAEA